MRRLYNTQRPHSAAGGPTINSRNPYGHVPQLIGVTELAWWPKSWRQINRGCFLHNIGSRRYGRITQAMATSPSTIRRLASRLVLLTLAWSSCQSAADSRELQSDLSVSIEPGQAVATSPLGGRREIPLDVQETVVVSDAKGINAIVVTSRRLLGFSSRTLTWSKTDRDLHEKIVERRILPTFSLVRTDKRLYGFRGANGIWFKEALGVREKVHRLHSNEYGSVAVTNERLVGFGPLLGEFSSKPLGVHERITHVGNENGIIIITTSQRTLVFGSRMSGWDEFE